MDCRSYPAPTRQPERQSITLPVTQGNDDLRQPRSRVGRVIKQVTRITLAGLMLVIAAGCLFLAWGALRQLGASHQDSPAWVDITFGLFWLALGGGAVVLAVQAFRRF